ncbi:tripartite-type tricarboxylate transporter receptor subunit TctC/citrate lyase beta subunit [Variovorax sp. TBS-050B]|nr:tripartite-type tricarboxylate transporter receptor subunit TctC/citrate lyase beta subunit [Variovorax sp. TBS-050B]
MRSKLFVPGTRPELFDKALGGAADSVCFDLEDAVAEPRKAEARETVRTLLQGGAAAASGKTVIVRVNAMDTRHFDADIAAVARPGVHLINLPKPESPAHVRSAVEAIERAEQAHGVAAPIGLLLNIESPAALRTAAQLATAHPRVAGLQLGLGDLFEPLGIARREPAAIRQAMFAVRMAAGEANVWAYDGAFADIRDAEGFRAEAMLARNLGFLGKTCIHPSQIRDRERGVPSHRRGDRARLQGRRSRARGRCLRRGRLRGGRKDDRHPVRDPRARHRRERTQPRPAAGLSLLRLLPLPFPVPQENQETRQMPIPSTLRALASAAALAAGLLSAGGASAQEAYPAKPITIVVPYPAGGSNDTFARQVAKELGDELRQPVIIDNRPGASGNTGTGQVAKAAPDGYTLVAVSSSMTTNAAVQAKMPFDPVTGLAPVAMFAKGPFIVAVNNEFAARTPAELIAAIKAKPGQYNYASSGTGSVNHFATELLKAKVGELQIAHIPYKGMGPAVTDLVGNQTQLLISSGPSLLPMVRSGKLRAVGITSLKPSPVAPELTPMAAAVPGYEFELWWGLLAPAGTPADVVAKLNATVNRILAKPAIAANFLKEGAIATPLSSAQFGAVIAEDVARWKKLAKQQNITAD